MRILSHVARFDAVRLLINSGADEKLLKWTPLHHAIAFSFNAEVKQLAEKRVDLEAKDHASRTPWLLAVQIGDKTKVQSLVNSGADVASRGHLGKASLSYAIENHDLPMLEWLLQMGLPAGQEDEFGTTPLMIAAEAGNEEAVDVLLTAGADVNSERYRQSVIGFSERREIVLRLLAGCGKTERAVHFPELA